MTMNQNKFMRIIWDINGVIILMVLLYLSGQFVKEWLEESSDDSPEVIVGDKLEEAKSEGLILQGLEVFSPIPIVGSIGYLVPVSVKTYDVARQETITADLAMASRVSFDYDAGDFGSRYGLINVVFLDNNLEPVEQLLKTKGFIRRFQFPQLYGSLEERKKNFIPINSYLICLKDSNGDGAINDNDDADLYISGLSGEDLTQVTSKLEVRDYLFLNSNEILIEYFKTKTEREEYKRPSFVRYLIKEKKLDELTSFNGTLNSLEAELSK